MNPREVISLRRHLVEWLRTEDAHAYYEMVHEGERDESENLLRGLTGASVFHVTEEMTAVARHAAKSMPDQKPRIEDFPAQRGFIVWDAPLVDDQVTEAYLAEFAEDLDNNDAVGPDMFATCRALSWDVREATVDGEPVPGMLLTFWVPFDRTVPVMIPWRTAYWGFDAPVRTLSRLDNVDHPPAGEWIEQFQMTAYATVILMGQTISATETVRADRPESRRGVRAQIPVSEVTVIKLRKRDSGQGSGESRPVDWQRRWVVDGHWRQQWYPSLNDHRAIYIHEYVKGPEDKPLVMGEKVHTLGR